MLQQQQQPMYHPGLITAMSQVTPPSLGAYYFPEVLSWIQQS
jgi:hypothetical protein